MSEFRRRLITAVSQNESEIPAGCVRCEYLKSTGKQWIDTEYYPQIGDEILINNVQLYGTSMNSLFSSGTESYQLILLSAGIKSYYYKYFATGEAQIVTFNIDSIHNIKINSVGEIYINGAKNQISVPDSITNTQLFLLKRANNTAYWTGTIGEFVVSKNGKDVLHFLPILDANATPCYYDVVNKKFHYNKGTGEFLYKILEQ